MDNLRVAIHQPNFIPWIGYFLKIYDSDIFVFLDDVQYEKNGYTNRNRININGISHWITIPVHYRFGDMVRDVKIDYSKDWQKSHLKTIQQSYCKYSGFNNVWSMIDDVYSNRYIYIYELNMALIHRICEYMKIQRKFVLSSDLKIVGARTDKIVGIVKALNGEVYISGRGAENYQDAKIYEKNNIELRYRDLKVEANAGNVHYSIVDFLAKNDQVDFDSLVNWV